MINSIPTSATPDEIGGRGVDICVRMRLSLCLLLAEVSQYYHLHMISQAIGWRKLWDDALDHGLYVVKGIKNLLRVIAYPDHAAKKCPLCDTKELDPQCLPDHFVTEHTKSEGSWNIQSVELLDHHGLLFLQSCPMLFKCFSIHLAYIVLYHYRTSLCFLCVCIWSMPKRAYKTWNFDFAVNEL